MKLLDEDVTGDGGDAADAVDDDADDAGMPCAAALLAGTLGLMTMWADPCQQARCSVAEQRHLMARKICSNLCLLKQHPRVSPPLRSVMSHAHRRWMLVAASVEDRKNGEGDERVSGAPADAVVHGSRTAAPDEPGRPRPCPVR